MTDYLQTENDYQNPEIASVFDELSFWSSRFGHLLFRHIPFKHGARILDLGCATGFPLFELAHTFGRTSFVTGIDLWKEALARAAVKRKIYDLPNISLIEADGAQQPFADAQFDLIVSNLGINNFANPLGVLDECFRVAKPGARLVLTTNIKGHYKEFYEIYRTILEEMKMTGALSKLTLNEDHRGTRESLRELLNESGWRITKTLVDNFQMRFADGSALLRHSLVRFGFLDGWKGVVDQKSQARVFEEIETRLNEQAHLAGELRMTVPVLYLEAEKLRWSPSHN